MTESGPRLSLVLFLLRTFPLFYRPIPHPKPPVLLLSPSDSLQHRLALGAVRAGSSRPVCGSAPLFSALRPCEPVRLPHALLQGFPAAPRPGAYEESCCNRHVRACVHRQAQLRGMHTMEHACGVLR